MAGDSPRFVPRSAEWRHPLDRHWARAAFLRAVDRKIPQVLADLHRSVYVGHAAGLLTRYRGPPLTGPAADPDDRDRVLGPLRPVIAEWADRSHLAKPGSPPGPDGAVGAWLEQVALDTCVAWHAGDNLTPPGWALSGRETLASSLDVPIPLTVEVAGWRPLQETADEFRRRAAASFDAQLVSYVIRCRSDMPAWPPVPTTLPPTCFDALALYQVGGLSINKIASKLGLSRRTVSGGYRAAAHEVAGACAAWWLRPPDRGGRRPNADPAARGRRPAN